MASGAEWAAVVLPCTALGLAVGMGLEMYHARRGLAAANKKAQAFKSNDLEAGSTLSVGLFDGLASEQPEEEPAALRSMQDTTEAVPYMADNETVQEFADGTEAVPYLNPATGRPRHESSPRHESGPQRPMPYVTRVTAMPYIDADTAVPYISKLAQEAPVDLSMPDLGVQEDSKKDASASVEAPPRSTSRLSATPPVSPRFVASIEEALKLKLERQQSKELTGENSLAVLSSKSPTAANIPVIDERLAELMARQQQKELAAHTETVAAVGSETAPTSNREAELAKSVVQSGLAVDLATKLLRQQQKERDGSSAQSPPRTPRGVNLKVGLDPQLAERLERQLQKESAEAATGA